MHARGWSLERLQDALTLCGQAAEPLFGTLKFEGLHHASKPQDSRVVLFLPRIDNVTMSESQKLLHEHPSDSDSDPEPERRPSPLHLSPSPSSSRAASTSPAPPGSRPNGFTPKRQSSFAQPRPDGAPRTPNRVRFEDSPGASADGGADWIELEGDDYMNPHGRRGRDGVQRLPLLTGIEAPSVTVAEESFDPEDYLENAKPRSGMKSAFMNMANSIM